MVLMYKPSVINAPSDGAPKKAPRWDLTVQKVAAVELGFRGCFCWFGGYVGIYRRKKYIGGATWGPRGWRVHPRGVGTPPTSCPPPFFLDIGSKSPGSCSFQKSRSRRFHSVWTPFDIPFIRNPKIGKKTAILG